MGTIDSRATGILGDCKRLRDGISELRIDWGPGYRVYYAMGKKTGLLRTDPISEQRTAYSRWTALVAFAELPLPGARDSRYSRRGRHSSTEVADSKLDLSRFPFPRFPFHKFAM